MKEGIFLTETIKTITRNKKIAIVITLSLISLSVLYNFLIAKPVYEATSMVVINNQFENNSEKVTNKDYSPFVEQVKSDYVINQIIDNLALKDKGFSVDKLKNAMNVQAIKNTNYIQVKIRNNDPAVANNIANYIAMQIGTSIEISDVQDKIVIYKNKLIEAENKYKETQNQFDNASNLLKDLPEKLSTKKSLSSDPYFQSVISDSIKNSNKEIGSLQLQNEEINPSYVTVKSKLAELSIDLAKYKTETKNLDERIKEFQNHTINLNEKLSEKISTPKTTSWFSDGLKAVMINPSLTPEVPIAPKKLMNVVITFVIALLISFLIIYIKEFYTREKHLSK